VSDRSSLNYLVTAKFDCFVYSCFNRLNRRQKFTELFLKQNLQTAICLRLLVHFESDPAVGELIDPVAKVLTALVKLLLHVNLFFDLEPFLL
jgi:hypothetical protein